MEINTTEEKVMELLGIEFPETVSRLWRDDSISTYPARKSVSHDGYFIALTRGSKELDPTKGERYEGPYIQVTDEKGESVGIGINVYGPEIRYADRIIDAQVNWNAIGSTDAKSTQVSAEALAIAASMAALWTELAMPRLLEEKAQEELEREERRAKIAAEADRKKAWVNARVDEAQGGVVRIKKTSKKTFEVGTIAADGVYLKIQRHIGVDPVRISLDEIDFLEYKQPNGQFKNMRQYKPLEA